MFKGYAVGRREGLKRRAKLGGANGNQPEPFFVFRSEKGGYSDLVGQAKEAARLEDDQGVVGCGVWQESTDG